MNNNGNQTKKRTFLQEPKILIIININNYK